MRYYKKKRIRKVLFGVFAFINVLIAPSAFADKKVLIAEPNHQLGYLPLYIAIDEGYFKKQGLDVQMLLAGGGQHINAVLTGNAFAFVGGPEWNAFARARAGGEDKAIMAVAGVVNRANVYMVGKPGVTQPTDPAALKKAFQGKTVIVGVNGSTSNSIPRYYLKSLGLDPDKDVTLVAVETGSIPPTFKSMHADYAAGVEPNLSDAIAKGIYSEPFVNFPKLWGEYAYSTLNVAEKSIKDDPDTVQKLVAGVAQALDLIESNHAEAIKIAEKEFNTIPANLVEQSVDRFISDGLWQGAKSITPQSYTTAMKIIVSTGKLKTIPEFTSLVDTQFMEHASGKN